MSTQQAVTIACRVLSVYLLTWLLTDLTYLPSNLYSFLHHESALGPFTTNYLRNSDLISLSFRALRMVALFFAVQWFYRAGPAVQRYLLPSAEED